MKKEELLELEKKIESNEKIIEKNATKIDKIFKKLEEYSGKINKNSFALEIIKETNKENEDLIKNSKFKNIIILIEALIILGLAAIVVAHHWK